MKAHFKEYVVIGNAGEMKQVIVLSDLNFNCTKQEYEAIVKSFEAEVAAIPFSNGFQKRIMENPNDALVYVENQKCVVTDWYDDKKNVWKKSVKLINVVEE